jgi:hypothetical protein
MASAVNSHTLKEGGGVNKMITCVMDDPKKLAIRRKRGVIVLRKASKCCSGAGIDEIPIIAMA